MAYSGSPEKELFKHVWVVGVTWPPAKGIHLASGTVRVFGPFSGFLLSILPGFGRILRFSAWNPPKTLDIEPFSTPGPG